MLVSQTKWLRLLKRRPQPTHPQPLLRLFPHLLRTPAVSTPAPAPGFISHASFGTPATFSTPTATSAPISLSSIPASSRSRLGPMPTSSPAASENYRSRSHNSTYENSKKAVSVQMYFKDDRFGGDTHESISHKIADYRVCAVQLGLDGTPMATCFVNVFKGNARRFSPRTSRKATRLSS